MGAGLCLVGGTGSYLLAAVGLIPLAMGVFDFCLLAPTPVHPLIQRRTHTCAPRTRPEDPFIRTTARAAGTAHIHKEPYRAT